MIIEFGKNNKLRSNYGEFFRRVKKLQVNELSEYFTWNWYVFI